MNNTKNKIIEFASFTLAPGVDESTLLAASDALQAEFLSHQKGFIRRDLVEVGNGKWADILYWDSRESVEHALQKASNHPAALRYFQLMDNPENNDAASGMILMDITKSYS
jgi:hypothetical protein